MHHRETFSAKSENKPFPQAFNFFVLSHLLFIDFRTATLFALYSAYREEEQKNIFT